MKARWFLCRLTSLTLLLTLGGSGLALAAAPAAPPPLGANLTISPSPLPLEAEPGTTISADIRIKNNNDDTEQLKVGLLKFGSTDQSGVPQLEAFGPNDAYKNWVSFSQDQVTAAPNVWNTIHMTIAVPKDAAFGYYFAATVSRLNPSGPKVNGAVFNGAAASLVLLDVESPNAKRTIQVLKVSSPHAIYQYLPTSFDVQLRNTGNTHTIPLGNIFIKRGSHQLAVLNINPTQAYILPQTNRIFTAKWDDGFPHYAPKTKDGSVVLDKKGNVEQGLQWGNVNFSKIRFGKYTAHFVVVYNNGQGDVAQDAELSFWVIPWELILILLAIVTIFGIGLYTTARGVGRGVRPRKR